MSKVKPEFAHYDLREQFSQFEAACLIAGVDPNVANIADDYGSKAIVQVNAVQDAIYEAYRRALNVVSEALGGEIMLDGCPHNVDVSWDRNGDNDSTALPSSELREALKAIRHVGNFEPWRTISGPFSETLSVGLFFRREDLARWLMNNDFLSAKYFVPVMDRNVLSFVFETPLLMWVARVQERYLGQSFDLNDSDTYPAKKNVIAWLREQDSTLTETTAAAIDRIAMPFSRDRKSKSLG